MSIYLYADESGNTGTNLFDNNQPFFYTATLFSSFDIDNNEEFNKDFSNILNSKNELHFNDLNKSDLKLISEQVLQLFEKYKINILLTMVEKQYLPKIHFFNTFFDSGLNPKVPPLMYGRRMDRFITLAIVLEGFTNTHAKEFYLLLENEDYDGISKFINKIHKIVIKNESKDLINIMNPIFDYAKQNTKNILSKFNKKELLPNFFVLPLIMQYAIEKYPNEKAIFKHDYNSKVFKGMNEIVNLACNYNMPENDFSLISHMEPNNTFADGIKFVDSKYSKGIQLSDFIVSFTKAYHEGKIDYLSSKNMCDFLEQASRNGVGEEFTFGELKNYEKYIKT